MIINSLTKRLEDISLSMPISKIILAYFYFFSMIFLVYFVLDDFK